MKELNVSTQVAGSDRAADRPRSWVDLLRSHCEILARMDPRVVSAISVTTHVDGDPAEQVVALRRASRLLADEFGFTTWMHISGGSISVQFDRDGRPSESATWRAPIHPIARRDTT